MTSEHMEERFARIREAAEQSLEESKGNALANFEAWWDDFKNSLDVELPMSLKSVFDRGGDVGQLIV